MSAAHRAYAIHVTNLSFYLVFRKQFTESESIRIGTLVAWMPSENHSLSWWTLRCHTSGLANRSEAVPVLHATTSCSAAGFEV